MNAGPQLEQSMLEEAKVRWAREAQRVDSEPRGKERVKGKTMERAKVGGEAR